MDFLIQSAYAQGAQQADPFGFLLPMIVIFGAFYFLLIRPQQKKQKAHTALISNLKAGDEVLTAGGRKVVVFTTGNPDPARVAEIESKAGQVVIAGKERVDGTMLVPLMTEMGYRTVYSATGPKVLHLLLAGGALHRLYLTYANRLLGGQPYSSIVEGSLFETAVDLRINTIHLDSQALDGLGQLFVSYDRA